MFQVLSRSILYCLIGDYVCKSQICDGRCCDGYIFDPANATCKRCSPGYFGVNCSTQCPYPLYGHTCQSVCLCNMDACSPANGCLHVVTAEATTKPLSTEEEDKETTSHHSQATVTKRKVSTVVQSTTTRPVNKQTTKDSYPYLIGIFVLILVLTLAYIGQCFYKRLFKANNANDISQPGISEVPGNENELDMRIPYDVIEDTTHSDVRQVNLLTYRNFYNSANETVQPYEAVENEKSEHEKLLLQDIKPEENVSDELKSKERQIPSLEKPENAYLTVLA